MQGTQAPEMKSYRARFRRQTKRARSWIQPSKTSRAASIQAVNPSVRCCARSCAKITAICFSATISISAGIESIPMSAASQSI